MNRYLDSPFNRTILELKWEQIKTAKKPIFPFNRTILELKFE